MMNISFTRVQFMLFMFVAQTGSVFILLQRPLIVAAGRDAWIFFILISFLHLALLLVFERYYPLFKLNKPLSLLYASYWLAVGVTSISYIDYTLATWAFPKTPQFIVIFLMVMISFYCNACRDEVAINLGVFLIPLIFLFILFLSMAYNKFEWTYLFPIGMMTKESIAQSVLKAQYPFIGIELYLIYRRYVKKEQSMSGIPVFIYHLIWLSFFLFTIMITLLFFPLPELESIPEPIMYILKSQQVTFVERLDLFFIYIWMVWSVITITIFSFTALFTLRQHFEIHRNKLNMVFHSLLFILPLFGLSKNNVQHLHVSLLYVHLAFVYVLPFLIILRNRRQLQ